PSGVICVAGSSIASESSRCCALEPRSARGSSCGVNNRVSYCHCLSVTLFPLFTAELRPT
ncbi:hypothetical protein BgiMline_033336, partial [Biomphalaria glabrata]